MIVKLFYGLHAFRYVAAIHRNGKRMFNEIHGIPVRKPRGSERASNREKIKIERRQVSPCACSICVCWKQPILFSSEIAMWIRILMLLPGFVFKKSK